MINNGKEKIISATEVLVDDTVKVLPGETIPVDGIIIRGETSIDQSVMTGESMPVDKKVGDEVYSGTVNLYGSFDMKTTRIGEDSSIQKMIRLVKSADAGKAKIVGMADRWATWIVIIALVSAVLTWLVTGEIIRAVTILVVFCPCSLVLATPTAIVAGIGNASKFGILVKEGDALERLAKINKLAFDKTGTLTYGKPKVTMVHSFDDNISNEELLKLASSVEKHSEHPLGKAIVEYSKLKLGLDFYDSSNFKMKIGKGVIANINEDILIAGNKRLLEENDIILNDSHNKIVEEYIGKGNTVIFIAINNTIKGFIILEDILRDNVKSIIKKIKDLGIGSILITGDNKLTSENIASISGIDSVYYEMKIT